MGIEFTITSDVRTDPGKKRDHNEDFLAFFVPDDPAERQRSGSLYIVADGVGGAMDGEIASRYAAEKILYDYYHDDEADLGERLRHIIQQTGNDIFEHSQTGGRFKRMATTVVAAAIQGERLIVANVGDSRAYMIRNGEAHQITRDHTIAGELLRDHKISEKEARDRPGKNRLTRSVGGESDVHVDIFSDIRLLPGDRILLCSDGLARYTLSQDIARLASSGSPEEVTKRCIAHANGEGGVDNVTVATIEIGPLAEGAATVRDPSAHAPTPVDLDTLSTDPSLTMVHRGKRRLKLERGSLLAAVGAIAVMGILVAVFVFGGNMSNNIIPTVVPSSENAVTQPSPLTSLPLTATQSLPLSSPPAVTQISTASNQTGLTGTAVVSPCVAEIRPAEGLRVYAWPDTDLGQITSLAMLSADEKVDVISRFVEDVNPWWQIRYNTQQEGWIQAGNKKEGNTYDFTILSQNCNSIPINSTIKDVCVYRVQPGEVSGLIAGYFGLSPSGPMDEQFEYIEWDPTNRNVVTKLLQKTQTTEGQDNWYIEGGWYLWVKQVLSRERCLVNAEHSGEWMRLVFPEKE